MVAMQQPSEMGATGSGHSMSAVTGTRGGLGRILLTAFLLLAIVPLSIVSYLAIERVRQDMRQAALQDLELAAAAIEAQLLGLDVQHGSPGFPAEIADHPALDDLRRAVGRMVGQEGERQDGGRVYLIDRDAMPVFSVLPALASWPAGPLHSQAIDALMRGEEGCAFYRDPFGAPVIGAYRWLADLQVGFLVEKPQEAVLAREDDLAAMLVGTTLAVALLTTCLAAVISRRLTRPIVRLTVGAVKIANGNLDQRVQVDRRDEIGILAQAFNIMAAELCSLYEGLEGKVAERTRQLVEANRQLRYQAMQLTLSAEVARVATSILDLDVLVRRVTELILDIYARIYYVYYVAILLQDECGEWFDLQARSGLAGRYVASRVFLGSKPNRSDGVAAPGDDPAATLIRRVVREDSLQTRELGRSDIEIVVPLRIGSRVIGVLDLYCSRRDVIQQQDLDVLQSLGDQISVAIENARAYAAERETVERLSRLDHVRLASLSVGSRELATELNTIIGFSRLLLKGTEGPLTDLQRADVAAIHKGGYSLLGLIDNVIALSELESGAGDLNQRSVDLSKVLDEVLSCVRQRFAGIGIDYPGSIQDVTFFAGGDGCQPLIEGDATLLQQAFLCLATAVADQIPQGTGTLIVRTAVTQEHTKGALLTGDCMLWASVWVSSHANGDWSELCNQEGMGWVQEPVRLSEDIPEPSVGLALARRIVALHRGRLQLCYDGERGMSSLILLPLGQVAVPEKESGL
jgi:signal transduction histidine kinase/HAMP domain-containing protein